MNTQMTEKGLESLVGDMMQGTVHERYLGRQARIVEIPQHVRETRKKVDEQNQKSLIHNS